MENENENNFREILFNIHTAQEEYRNIFFEKRIRIMLIRIANYAAPSQITRYLLVCSI